MSSSPVPAPGHVPAALTRGSRRLPFVYGHRGTRRGAPENTLEAMRRALAQGADGIELDVRLCASGEVVVVHDPDLQRVAGVRLRVAEASLAELQGHDLGGGARVPTLAAAIELVLGAGKLLNIELKSDVPDPGALVAAVVSMLQAGTAAERERVLLSSFSLDVCADLCDALPAVPGTAPALRGGASIAVGALFESVPSSLPSGVCAVHPRHVLVDDAAIARWRSEQLLINTWTVNHPARAAELARAGVDAIITDDVPAILAAL